MSIKANIKIKKKEKKKRIGLVYLCLFVIIEEPSTTYHLFHEPRVIKMFVIIVNADFFCFLIFFCICD
jgi:hypothetical protein